jgi:imidazolonepropionase
MQISLALAVVRLGLTAEEAFSAATINSAYAAGRGDVTGSIEVGKHADLLLLNTPDYREVPSQFGVNHVDMAIRGGNVVLNRTRWKAMKA